MIELARHIETLLLDNDCVIIPNFGGFVAYYEPSVYIKDEELFLPPMRIVGFNPKLQLNDGLLVQFYMRTYKMEFPEASRALEKDVSLMVQTLHEEGKLYLENIGELYCDIQGNYKFKPCKKEIVTPFFYGLDSFQMKELASLSVDEERTPTLDVSSPRKRTFSIAVLRNMVAAVVAAVLFFALSTPVENTRIEEGYAQLLPREVLESATPQTVTPEVDSTALKATAAPQKEREKAEILVPQARKLQSQPAVSPKNLSKAYHVIVAGGIGLKDAEAMAAQLRKKGFSEAEALNCDGGKVRVSIYSSESRKEALRMLSEVRKSESYRNAWLLNE